MSRQSSSRMKFDTQHSEDGIGRAFRLYDLPHGFVNSQSEDSIVISLVGSDALKVPSALDCSESFGDLILEEIAAESHSSKVDYVLHWLSFLE